MAFRHRLALAAKYLRHYITARRHPGRSPFVQAFVRDVLRDDEQPAAFEKIEALRRELLRSDEVLKVTDLGAGSQTGADTLRNVSYIARVGAKPAKYGRLFYRLMRHLQPREVLELGTSLGLSAAYMAAAKPDAHVVTVEGCPNVAGRARQNFEALALHNVEQRIGSFDDVLPALLQELPHLDWLYVDGNHRKEPTLSYFSQCLTRANDRSVFIFDDIRWSSEMEEAWHIIQQHPRVTLTIDLFFVGLVFFSPDIDSEKHLVLRY